MMAVNQSTILFNQSISISNPALYLLYIKYKMDRPCAYCKEYGHHIRYCAVLENKKPRKVVAINNAYVLPTLQVRPVVVTTSNRFATIYSSSDDEVEDGEIVEDDRIRVVQQIDDAPESHHFSAPLIEQSWSRSGIVAIKIPIYNHANVERTIADEDYVSDSEAREAKEHMRMYLAKYIGRSWADFSDDENDSE